MPSKTQWVDTMIPGRLTARLGAILLSWGLLASPTQACPTSLEPLIEEMLPDLPGYVNRVLRRSQTVQAPRNHRTTVLVAGNPEFEPLPLNEPIPEGVEQVFLTTLERTHRGGQTGEIQHFHWLFLTQNEEGWWLVSLFSSLGDYPEPGIVSPPRESSQGAVGQAVQTWLRDCRFRR
ncbi:hypothetical protein E1H12_20800 [Geitlerinema sp. P-1104]|uniref:hypothetical protein n=1 Tax=Geitlerinema sp. P-1104 TaxID=2546230 RepID=UPI001476C7CA|nr:hypothetical protein [Geitlerinema sp. P-1104]NMG60879.1 hypothetical protein [Geitlerinema sp. P-1104]